MTTAFDKPAISRFEFVGLYSADKWNTDIVDRYRANRPVEIRADRTAGFRHPWHCQVTWSEKQATFLIDIQPGYVMEEEVEIRIPTELAPPPTLEREEPTGDKVTALLSDGPPIPIPLGSLRAIGTDALAISGNSEAIPEVFAAQGVQPPTNIQINEGLAGVTLQVNSTTADEPRRLLRAIDLVITKQRPSLSPVWIEAGAQTLLSLTVVNPDQQRARLSLQKKFEPPLAVEYLAEQIAAGLTDTPFDATRIATVYFLSADGARDGSEPDAEWESYVKHHEHWNLNYDIDQDIDRFTSAEPLRFDLPLAGGIANPIIDQFLNANSSALNQASNLLNNSRIGGRFWT